MSHAEQLHHRRYLNDNLEIINREGLPGNVKTDLCLTVQDTVIATGIDELLFLQKLGKIKRGIDIVRVVLVE